MASPEQVLEDMYITADGLTDSIREQWAHVPLRRHIRYGVATSARTCNWKAAASV